MKAKALSYRQAAARFGWPAGRMKICELTLGYSCNARCVFCYSSPELENWKERPSMDLRRAGEHLLASYKNGARMLQIIGGEPTINEDLPRVISLAKRTGYLAVQIVSNGLKLADEDFVKTLVKSGLNTANLSIHGPDRVTHDAVVGVEGAFESTLKAARNLIDAGVYINTGTAVTGINYRKIPALAAFVLRELGVDSCHIIAAHYLGAAFKRRRALRVTYTEQMPYIKKAVAAFRLAYVRPAFAFLSNYLPCVLPGYEALMGDWKYPEADDDLYLPEASHEGRMYTMITETLRMKSPYCKRCVYCGVCAGFEKTYFEMFGGGEFVPLLEKPDVYPLKPVCV